MKQWTTTYGAVVGILRAIRSGTSPQGANLYDEDLKPIYRRSLSPGALLAIRRFVRVMDGAFEDFQAAQEIILDEAREELGEGANLTEEYIDRLNTLGNEELELEVSPVPVEVLLEQGQLTLVDLEILDPIVDMGDSA